jgi:hypothetical protein
MHAALDAALVTLKTEAAETAKKAAAAAQAAQLAAAGGGGAAAAAGSGSGPAEVAAAVGDLRRDFDDMRGAIKRNAQWLLQGA